MNCLKCCLQIDHKSVVHYGLHPTCFTEWFKTPPQAEFVSLQRRSSASDQSANQTPQNRSEE
ncbi:MAG: hypothetical protein EPO11_08590, partial [Gammaproteobacteria bacterium]